MNKYERGKIYKLIDNTSDKVYIGSTTEHYLSNRKAKHNCSAKRHSEGKSGYQSSYEIIKNGNWDMVLIELFSCSCKEELHKRERYWIDITDNCVNIKIPSRKESEYPSRTKERRKIVNDKYHHSAKGQAKKKEYYKNNKNKFDTT